MNFFETQGGFNAAEIVTSSLDKIASEMVKSNQLQEEQNHWLKQIAQSLAERK